MKSKEIDKAEQEHIKQWSSKYLSVENDGTVNMNGCFITIAGKPDMLEMHNSCDINDNSYGYLIPVHGIVRMLARYDICRVEAYKDFEKDGTSDVACIGYSESNQGWLGWSHRANFMFNIGYVVKEGTLCTKTCWIESYEKEHPERCFNVPAGFVCKTLEDCRTAAIAFAMAVA